MSTNELELKPGLKPKPPAPATTEKGRLCNTGYQGFGAGLFWGGSGSGSWWKNIILEFFKTGYEWSKKRFNSCTSTYRS